MIVKFDLLDFCCLSCEAWLFCNFFNDDCV